MSLLVTRGLTKSYRSANHELTVLSDITLTVASGETCAIIGPSGSGKTTLLGLCAGLDQPTSGTVELAGHNLGALDEDGRASVRNQHVGFVFQNFQLLPSLTALENVLVPAELRNRTVGPPPEKSARDLLARVGLAERANHYPPQLSGGEQQRVALARALINRPQILFADEPTGNLDHETADQIIQLLFELNQNSKTALILVTHDPDLARRCSQILRLRNGRTITEQTHLT